MPLYLIIETVTERRQYLVDAPDLDIAQDRIDNGEVLPQAVRETARDTSHAREVTKDEMVDS